MLCAAEAQYRTIRGNVNVAFFYSWGTMSLLIRRADLGMHTEGAYRFRNKATCITSSGVASLLIWFARLDIIITLLRTYPRAGIIRSTVGLNGPDPCPTYRWNSTPNMGQCVGIMGSIGQTGGDTRRVGDVPRMVTVDCSRKVTYDVRSSSQNAPYAYSIFRLPC
jgi:hypothetical protein